MHIDPRGPQHNQLILVHTRTRRQRGTRAHRRCTQNDKRIKPERVIIDHVEDTPSTSRSTAGFWAGMTLYTESNARRHAAIDMMENYGASGVWMNSAWDWA